MNHDAQNNAQDNAQEVRRRIRHDALSQGFDAVAFTSASAQPLLAARLKAFIDSGYHASMAWLAETQERRIAPTAMWSAAKTALVLVMNYAPSHDPMDNLHRSECGNISVYARGRDYHDVIKGRLKQIASRIAAKEKAQVKVFVDTAPLMEKPLAAQAGLGWQGKHTNLVSRDYGSWLFIGVILTDADWAEPAQEADHCGTCTRCLDICPTKAFPAPYQLDARRCISYLTIEHDGMIPLEFRKAIGNRIFGCDDCLAVCPWNRFAQHAQEAKLKALPARTMPMLTDLLGLDEAGFKAQFSGSPIKRGGYVNFMRNVLIAAGNAENGAARLIRMTRAFLSSPHSTLKATAIWALKQQLSEADFKALKARYADSSADDAMVAAEWG